MSSLSGGEEVEFVDGLKETKLDFTGRARAIFGIWILNCVLSIITLGIYSFWGRVNIRRYIWQSTRYEDEAFEYTGTGGELFIGFLIVFFIVLVPISAAKSFSQYLLGLGHMGWTIVAGALTYGLIVFLIGIAIHRVRKYQLSRTLWRGIRGALGGSSIRYGAVFLGYMGLNVVTLGLAYPYTSVRLWSRLANETWIGSGRLHFEGGVKDLYRPFLIAWGVFFAAPILMAAGSVSSIGLWQLVPVVSFFAGGIAYQWFRAAQYRLFTKGTTFEDGVSFRLDLSGAKMLGFTTLNYFLLAITLGFATSYILVRGGRLIADRLTIVGEPDYEAISQSTSGMPKFGEGLGEAFDVGGF